MNKFRTIFSFFIALLIQTQVYGQMPFNYRYGSLLLDRPKKVIESDDKKLLIAGYTKGFGAAENGFLLKMDGNGNPLWMKDYPGINSDYIFDFIQLPDHSLVMTGYTESFTSLQEGFVMKTDSTGNLIWAKRYNPGHSAYCFKIISDRDSGFYVAGFTMDQSNNEGIFVTHLDGNGAILWTKWASVWDHQGDWWPVDIVAPASGGVLLCGTEINANSLSCWKLNSSGSLSWSKKYTPTLNTNMTGPAMIEKPNGEIAIGFTMTAVQGGDLSVITIDSLGSMLSFRTYGAPINDFFRSISNTPDGGLLLCGFTNSVGNGSNDNCLVKLAPNGNAQWAAAYGSVWQEYAANAIPINGGGYALTGQTYSFGTNPDSSKIQLIQTDSLGNTPCTAVAWTPLMANQTAVITTPVSINAMTFQAYTFSWNATLVNFHSVSICGPLNIPDDHQDDILLYPNPFSTEFSVVIPSAASGNIYFFLKDVTGEIVYRGTEQNAVPGNTLRFDPGNLSAGIYLLEIISGDKTTTRRIIKN
jgi:hypothetical protein